MNNCGLYGLKTSKNIQNQPYLILTFVVNQRKQKCFLFYIFWNFWQKLSEYLYNNHICLFFLFSFLKKSFRTKLRPFSGATPEWRQKMGAARSDFFSKKLKRRINRYAYHKDILKVLAKNSKKCRTRNIFACAD